MSHLTELDYLRTALQHQKSLVIEGNNRIVALSNDNLVLRKRIEILENEKTICYDALDESKKTIQRLEIRVFELLPNVTESKDTRTSFDEVVSENTRLKTVNHDLQYQLEEQETEAENRRKRCQELERTVQEQKIAIDRCREVEEHSQTTIVTLRKLIAELKESVIEADSTAEYYCSCFEREEKAHSDVQDSLIASEARLRDATIRIETLQTRVNELEVQNIELNEKALRNEIENEYNRRRMTKQFQSHRNTVKQLRKNQERIKSRDVCIELARMNSTIATLRNERDVFFELRATLAKLETAQENADRIGSENIMLKEQLRQTVRSRARLMAEMKDLTDELFNSRREITEMKMMMHRLEKESADYIHTVQEELFEEMTQHERTFFEAIRDDDSSYVTVFVPTTASETQTD